MLLRSFLVLASLLAGSAAAADPIDQIALDDLGRVTVAAIQDDGALKLADGRSLLLAGIELPRGARGKDAVTALTDLTRSGQIALKSDGTTEDRYGRVVAQAFTDDGTWIEGVLLRQGLARVATTIDHRAAAAALYAAERGACAHRIGLWGDPDYALRRPRQAAHMIDSWQVVDGTVMVAQARRGGVDLAFGDDPGRDLAVRIPGAIVHRMDYDPATLKGSRIRVRGWIGKSLGPMITLNHAEQIERIGRGREDDTEEP